MKLVKDFNNKQTWQEEVKYGLLKLVISTKSWRN